MRTVMRVWLGMGLALAMSLGQASQSRAATASSAERWAAELLAKRASMQGKVTVKETHWYQAGPFKASSLAEQFFPEKSGVDLEAGRRGQKWQGKVYANGKVNYIRARQSTVTYLYRTLVVEKPCLLQFSVGSSGGITFWVNGDRLLSRDTVCKGVPGQEVVRASLLAGTNTVLVKLFSPESGLLFFYNTDHSVSGAIEPIAERFPEEEALFAKYANPERWFANAANTTMEQGAINRLLNRLPGVDAERQQFATLVQAQAQPQNPAWLTLFAKLASRAQALDEALAQASGLNLNALRLAVEDLTHSFPDQYKRGAEFLREIEAFEKDLPALKKGLEGGDPKAVSAFERIKALEREALLANPLLDFKEILLVKRREDNLGLPQNWQGNSSLPPQVESELIRMPIKANNPPLQLLYKSEKNYFAGDLDLNYDAEKLLFSSIGSHNRWQVFEIKLDGTGLRQVTPGEEPDIDNYSGIYLPDGRIIFDSTSTFVGVPCVGGSDYVANLHLMNPDGTGIRRLCFDQDNDWYPVMLASGKVMYLRWEYTDSAHYFSRNLMSMNPDGTGQMAVYHSNSYWPNSTFCARQLPGSPTKFVAIISGHHGVPRMGEMVIFDTAKGRQEDSGAVQRIPGYGKPVKGVIKDTLVNDSWPKFLHPYPLSEKYFLAACKPSPSAAWGIYLVDIFDNMLLLKQEPGWALFEPYPIRPRQRPPVIPDQVKLSETNATVYIHNVYVGTGLRGVPTGTVKRLRVFQYEYSYRNQGGHYFVGMEGGWDIRRLIGTVPVEKDGSAMFTIPANTPVAVQPLDAEGKALQQMRSWFVGMPGEFVSCVGCHERQNSIAPTQLASAATKAPVKPEPWYGPKRGFSFVREVQPVLDKYCVGCHNGQPDRPNLADPSIIRTSGGISPLPRSYTELHPYIRRNGPEGDYHTLTPLEFHANTSLLVQMLRKGHHNVKLDEEAWDRLITWIDINVPAYGTYHEVAKIPSNFEQRRYEAKKKYAHVDEDIEAIPNPERKPVTFVQPAPEAARPACVTVAGWPFGPEKASQMQAALGASELKMDLGQGITMVFKHIPAGTFAMGDVGGAGNEYPMAAVKISRPFWMATTEVTLEQYQQFDPAHRNGYYDMHYKDQVKPGYLMDDPRWPVIRVSWEESMAFCRWLSARTGRKVLLPTEAQWEWACRAGTDTAMYYGGLDTDFSHYANLADASLSKLAVSGVNPQPIPHPDKFWDFVPKDSRFNDGVVHLAQPGHYQPNAWGLCDMIGNVAEWTLDNYRPYPYQPKASEKDAAAAGIKVVRGGSWAERPKDARASSRWDYPAWQRVYNVGFRVVVLD